MLRRLAFILFSVILVFIVLAAIGSSNRPTASRTPYTITGARGTINIPSTRHIDAFDPATNSNIDEINVWRTAGRGNQAPACQLEHGDEIAIDNSEEADGEIFVHIVAERCTGWLLTEFVGR